MAETENRFCHIMKFGELTRLTFYSGLEFISDWVTVVIMRSSQTGAGVVCNCICYWWITATKESSMGVGSYHNSDVIHNYDPELVCIHMLECQLTLLIYQSKTTSAVDPDYCVQCHTFD